MKTNLLPTGQKFEVVAPTEDSTYSVGSQGFMAYLEKIDSSFMNVAQMRAIFVRRGKGGKERLETARIFIPVFTIDSKNFNKAMPSKDNRKSYLHIETVNSPATSVMDMSAIDFLGWAVAQVKNLRNMVEQCKHSNWPQSSSHPINQVSRLLDYFNENPEEYKNTMGAAEFRANFIGECRTQASSMVRVGLIRAMHRAEVIQTAAEFLQFTNNGEFIPKDADDKTNEYRFTENEKRLADNIKKWKNKHKYFSKLSDKKTVKG